MYPRVGVKNKLNREVGDLVHEAVLEIGAAKAMTEILPCQNKSS
jgi:hypothetical protein